MFDKVDPNELNKILEKFLHGQCSIQTTSGETYRGMVDSYAVHPKKFSVSIRFSWLAKLQPIYVLNINETRPRWFIVSTCPNGYEVVFNYASYYYQTDEDRVKIKGRAGEICRFYKADDHTNIVQLANTDQYIPHCHNGPMFGFALLCQLGLISKSRILRK
jgi:hypothetical protein